MNEASELKKDIEFIRKNADWFKLSYEDKTAILNKLTIVQKAMNDYLEKNA